MSAFYARIVEAIKVHDAALATCPINNPRNARERRWQDKCDRCGATSSGSCGIAAGAGYQLAGAVRRAVCAEEASI